MPATTHVRTSPKKTKGISSNGDLSAHPKDSRRSKSSHLNEDYFPATSFPSTRWHAILFSWFILIYYYCIDIPCNYFYGSQGALYRCVLFFYGGLLKIFGSSLNIALIPLQSLYQAIMLRFYAYWMVRRYIPVTEHSEYDDAHWTGPPEYCHTDDSPDDVHQCDSEKHRPILAYPGETSPTSSVDSIYYSPRSFSPENSRMGQIMSSIQDVLPIQRVFSPFSSIYSSLSSTVSLTSITSLSMIPSLRGSRSSLSSTELVRCDSRLSCLVHESFQAGYSLQGRSSRSSDPNSSPRLSGVPRHPRCRHPIVRSVSFAGGGMLWCYYLGVGHFLFENFDISKIKFLASSGGSFAAVPVR